MDLVTMLKKCPEPLPEWLQKPAPRFDRASFFGSRTVYYPGFGNDGHPVSICARAHAAHAFVYVDYNVSKETVSERVNRIGDPGFVGYEVEHEEEVSESDLRPGGWPQHVEKRDLPQDPYWFANVTPYGLLVVLKRREDRDGSHGPERLALLFVGGDGHATYDALYCQNDGTCPPFLVVVQDHGFGGNFSAFGAGGLLERIARRCDVFPKWLLVGARGRHERFQPWSGYRDAGAESEPGGEQGNPRRLFLMPKPNLFDHATKELSQDAVICWLIKWSGTRTKDASEQVLRDLGHEFVSALLARHDAALKGSVKSTEIHQQNLGIDVLARVTDEETSHILLIEDKTFSNRRSGQIERYHQRVLNGESALGNVPKASICPVFLKTGNQSLSKDRQTEEESGYRVFGRGDFLEVLDTYRGNHPIVCDFQEYLRRLETEFSEYRHWGRKDDRHEWSWGAWEGFFQSLETWFDDADWGYVPNPSGGFLGFWWHWRGATAATTLYLQLEIRPWDPKRQKLCFKVERGDHDGETARDRYHAAVLAAGEGRVERPSRMRVGNTMTVGWWSGDWLAFQSDGRLDMEGTIDNLTEAERIVDAAANAN